ncbi:MULTISPECIES: carbohydrate ABC transporter permease [Pacificibacter]|uniref:carbohydrate ABC transporter permease n=1 Tax=Pacificibacter TaxID=1042323 RepID=UPI001C09F2B0|nr:MULTISPECIES: carbohydrate ABC transporter permease [Pacificibacter]MBU2937170.1 carbohydrate ABC transporter permease [Pacificibacter marinus]MDO6617010.1 carbohydrate ABC transporter permease [Pacificibacter sp. 1_MG-2023]
MIDVNYSAGRLSFSHVLGRGFIYGCLIFCAVIYMMPFLIMLSTSVRPLAEIKSGTIIAFPREITFDAWTKAWGEACIGTKCSGLSSHFWISLKVVIPSVLVTTILGVLNGYALTKWKFRGANLVFGLMLLGCFVPFQAILLPMAQTLGVFGISNTPFGLALVLTLYGIPFSTLFFRNYYVSIPDDLVKAATIDGAGFFSTLWYIIVPLSPPIIVVNIIWQFTNMWNDFLFGASFSNGDGQPVIVALNNMVNTTTGVKEYNVDFAASIIAALPTILVYVVAGKYFIRGLTAGSVKG